MRDRAIACAGHPQGVDGRAVEPRRHARLAPREGRRRDRAAIRHVPPTDQMARLPALPLVRSPPWGNRADRLERPLPHFGGRFEPILLLRAALLLAGAHGDGRTAPVSRRDAEEACRSPNRNLLRFCRLRAFDKLPSPPYIAPLTTSDRNRARRRAARSTH